MRGSIRAILGFIIVLGVAGGIDTATDSQLPVAFLLAISGLLLMYSGVHAMSGANNNG